MKKLVLLSGKKRHGKDTCANFMKQIDPRTKLYAFATPLKQIVSETLNIPMPILEEYKNDGFVCMHGIPPANQENTEFEMQSYRDILQRFGTEAMKPIFGKEVWSMLAVRKINELFNYTDMVVVTDWRFIEEYEYIMENIGEDVEVVTLRVNRPDATDGDQHSSETALDDFRFHAVITNGSSLDDLKIKVEEFMNA